MDAPLSLYLARFTVADGCDGAPMAPHVEPDQAALERPGPPSPVEPLVTLGIADLEARLAAARRSAMAEAAAAHEAAAADAALAQAAETAAAIAVALAAARVEWAAGEGRAAAAGLEAVATLRELLAAKVADVLRPLLAQALAERARIAVGVALDQILDDPDQPCLTVSGPADLLEAIRAARPAAGAISYVVADVPDVTVAARATHMETRLGAALAALAAPPATLDTGSQP